MSSVFRLFESAVYFALLRHDWFFIFQTKIGRHTSNDIVLAETRVSRFHVEIVVINERIFLIDKKVRFVEFCHDFMEVDMNG